MHHTASVIALPEKVCVADPVPIQFQSIIDRGVVTSERLEDEIEVPLSWLHVVSTINNNTIVHSS